MKKLLAVLCVMLMVLSFGACSKSKAGGSPELEEYLRNNREYLEEMILDEMDLDEDDAQINIYVEGNGYVFDIMSAEFDEIPQEYLSEFQAEISEDGAEACEEMVEDMRDDAPSLKNIQYATIVLRNSKGAVIASVSNK